jgi:hypothetical protein
MKGRLFLPTSVLLTVLLISTVLGVKQQRIAPPKKPVKPAPKPALVKKTMKSGLPEQPKCNYPASPDLIVEKLQYSGPAGPFKPSQRYTIGVTLKNTGQFESGVFIVKLQVRVQAPQDRVDQVVDVGSKQVSSIQPCKTGVSPGTATVSFNYTTGNYVWAQYNFTATADATNHIQEWDERNNAKTGSDQIADTLRTK